MRLAVCVPGHLVGKLLSAPVQFALQLICAFGREVQLCGGKRGVGNQPVVGTGTLLRCPKLKQDIV